MSFVSVIAQENFITIMCDGRVTGPNGAPIQEDYKKFVELRDGKAFIAYAGTKDICEIITRDLVNILQNHPDYKSCARLLEDVITKLDLKSKGFYVNFAIGGLNKDNGIEFYSVNSANIEVKGYTPIGDDISYSFLSNRLLEHNVFENKLIEVLRETGFGTPSQTIQAQRLLNNFVAGIDPTVNTTTFRMTIRKQV